MQPISGFTTFYGGRWVDARFTYTTAREEEQLMSHLLIQKQATRVDIVGYSKFLRGLYKAIFLPNLQRLVVRIPPPSTNKATLTLILLSTSWRYMPHLEEFTLNLLATGVLPPEVIHNLSTNTSADCKKFDFWYQGVMFDVPLLDLLLAKKGLKLAYLKARVPKNREVCKRILSIVMKNLRVVQCSELKPLLQPFSSTYPMSERCCARRRRDRQNAFFLLRTRQ